MNRYDRRASRERVAVLGMALLAALVTVGAVGSMLPTARAATNHVIDMEDYFFSPKFLTIAPGDTVQWHDASIYSQHTATSNTSAWTEVTLNPGQTSSMITLNTQGNYTYICSIHFGSEGMWGAIEVGSGGAIPEFSSSLLVVAGLMVLMIGMMLLGGRRKKA